MTTTKCKRQVHQTRNTRRTKTAPGNNTNSTSIIIERSSATSDRLIKSKFVTRTSTFNTVMKGTASWSWRRWRTLWGTTRRSGRTGELWFSKNPSLHRLRFRPGTPWSSFVQFTHDQKVYSNTSSFTVPRDIEGRPLIKSITTSHSSHARQNNKYDIGSVRHFLNDDDRAMITLYSERQESLFHHTAASWQET